ETLVERLCAVYVGNTNQDNFELHIFGFGHSITPQQSMCVAGKDEVAIFNRFVTRKALFHIRLWSRFPIPIELSVAPAARCGVLFRVLDHELKVPGRRLAGNERLLPAKGFVVFLRWYVTPGYSPNDGAFR